MKTVYVNIKQAKKGFQYASSSFHTKMWRSRLLTQHSWIIHSGKYRRMEYGTYRAPPRVV